MPPLGDIRESQHHAAALIFTPATQQAGIDPQPTQILGTPAHPHDRVSDFTLLSERNKEWILFRGAGRTVRPEALNLKFVRAQANQDAALATEHRLGGRVAVDENALRREHCHPLDHGRQHATEPPLAVAQLVEEGAQFGDVFVDPDKAGVAPFRVLDRRDEGPLPIQRAVLAPVLQITAPDPARSNLSPQRFIHFGIGLRRPDQTRGLPDDFAEGVARGIEKGIVGVFDPALGIGNDDARRVLLDRQRQFSRPRLRCLLPGVVKDEFVLKRIDPPTAAQQPAQAKEQDAGQAQPCQKNDFRGTRRIGLKPGRLGHDAHEELAVGKLDVVGVHQRFQPGQLGLLTAFGKPVADRDRGLLAVIERNAQIILRASGIG